MAGPKHKWCCLLMSVSNANAIPNFRIRRKLIFYATVPTSELKYRFCAEESSLQWTGENDNESEQEMKKGVKEFGPSFEVRHRKCVHIYHVNCNVLLKSLHIFSWPYLIVSQSTKKYFSYQDLDTISVVHFQLKN